MEVTFCTDRYEIRAAITSMNPRIVADGVGYGILCATRVECHQLKTYTECPIV